MSTYVLNFQCDLVSYCNQLVINHILTSRNAENGLSSINFIWLSLNNISYMNYHLITNLNAILTFRFAFIGLAKRGTKAQYNLKFRAIDRSSTLLSAANKSTSIHSLVQSFLFPLGFSLLGSLNKSTSFAYSFLRVTSSKCFRISTYKSIGLLRYIACQLIRAVYSKLLYAGCIYIYISVEFMSTCILICKEVSKVFNPQFWLILIPLLVQNCARYYCRVGTRMRAPECLTISLQCYLRNSRNYVYNNNNIGINLVFMLNV